MRPMRCHRLDDDSLVPTIDTVIGIIGYRHGVRLVATPARYTAPVTRIGLADRSIDMPATSVEATDRFPIRVMKSGHTERRRRRVSPGDCDGTPELFHETRRACRRVTAVIE